ncbi:uncharacterized protein [Amphiura filiformis]|uniref:uncharacterized protein n=1 Tax=Amphiura filiformis TaxID=82378 RepID=UPI003B215075
MVFTSTTNIITATDVLDGIYYQTPVFSDNEGEPPLKRACMSLPSAVKPDFGEEKASKSLPSAVKPDFGEEKGIFTIPEFSTRVKMALETGISKEWDKMIEETSYHILANGDMKDPKSYEKFSLMMFAEYPCIACDKPPEPWTFFKERLSQKLRNIRWSQKKRSENFPMKKTGDKTWKKLASVTVSDDKGVSESKELDTFVRNMCNKGHVDQVMEMYAHKMAKRGRVTAKSLPSVKDRQEIDDFVDYLDNTDEVIMQVYTLVRNMPSKTGQPFKTKVLGYEFSGDIMMHTCQHIFKEFEDAVSSKEEILEEYSKENKDRPKLAKLQKKGLEMRRQDVQKMSIPDVLATYPILGDPFFVSNVYDFLT